MRGFVTRNAFKLEFTRLHKIDNEMLLHPIIIMLNHTCMNAMQF